METLQDIVHSLEHRGDAIAQSWRKPINPSLSDGSDVNTKKNPEIISRSYKQLYNDILTQSKGFSTFHGKGDRVFLYCDTDPNYIALFLAMTYAGIVPVPRWLDSSLEELDTLINHSGAETIIVQNKKAFDRIASLKDKSLKM